MSDERLLHLLAAIIQRWILDAMDDEGVAAFLEIDITTVATIRSRLQTQRRDNRSWLWS
ncbi:MAG: hypothetical protein ABTQ25_09500 [Nitrosomonas ureae]|mgnify:CR=1 FL=1